VPADNKWFSRLIVAAAIVEAVGNLDLSYPKIGAAKKQELAAARAALAREEQRSRVTIAPATRRAVALLLPSGCSYATTDS
jgi:hypothetical protein